MQIERFCQVSDEKIVGRLSQNGVGSSEIDIHKELCISLGFKSQIALTSKPEEIEARIFYPRIEGYELDILNRFYTRHYSRNEKQWQGYNFDVLPTQVLEEIQTAISLRVFDDVEIWTPESPLVNMQNIPQILIQNMRRVSSGPDPMAVGIVGSRLPDGSNGSAQFFSIVRWAEALRPFEEIEIDIFRGMVVYYDLKNASSKSLHSFARFMSQNLKLNRLSWNTSIYYHQERGHFKNQAHCRMENKPWDVFRMGNISSREPELWCCGVCGYSELRNAGGLTI